ncbi:MAG: DUF4398 domain-containing protein [Spirochaetes bacterium]|nr:DUF4398 domain-containing protein [Spirochaetota bacterium]
MKNFSFSCNKSFILPGFFMVMLIFSCKSAVPIKEMSAAKMGITRAEEVKAEKYAPDELNKAKEDLLKSHDYIKEDDNEKAKNAASGSGVSSKEGIDKSLPLLAADTIIEAKDVLAEAENANAEEYAPDEYYSAEDHITRADSLNVETEYWEAYLEAQKAISIAAGAREKALANSVSLQERITAIREKALKLEEIGGKDIAPEEMKLIDDYLEQAETSIDNKNLVTAFGEINDADSALEAATLKVWKQIATDKLRVAEDVYSQIDNSKHRDAYSNDLGKAKALITEAGELLANESYTDSAAKSEEAIDILNSISIAMEKVSEEMRIEEKIAEENQQTDVNEYVVKYNPANRDCLWKIAMNLYKDARLWPLIYMANRDQIKDPDLIFPGQKLLIPPVPKRSDFEENETEDITGIESVEEPAVESGEADKETGISTDSDNDENMNIPDLREDESGQTEDETIEEGEEPENDLPEYDINEDGKTDGDMPAGISSNSVSVL